MIPLQTLLAIAALKPANEKARKQGYAKPYADEDFLGNT